MSPIITLRRSQRRRSLGYHAGDIVEITYKRDRIGARLIEKHSSSSTDETKRSSASPRWTVELLPNGDNRSISEKSFIRLIDPEEVPSQEPSQPAQQPKSKRSGAEATTTHHRKRQKRGVGRPSSRDTAIHDDVNDGRRSDTSSDKNSANFSSSSLRVHTRSTSKPTLSTTSHDSSKDDSPTSSAGRPKKNSSVVKTKAVKAKRGRPSGKKKKNEKEEVVKVKLRTGTLYMYRGKNPRAEFIRFF